MRVSATSPAPSPQHDQPPVLNSPVPQPPVPELTCTADSLLGSLRSRRIVYSTSSPTLTSSGPQPSSWEKWKNMSPGRSICARGGCRGAAQSEVVVGVERGRQGARLLSCAEPQNLLLTTQPACLPDEAKLLLQQRDAPQLAAAQRVAHTRHDARLLSLLCRGGQGLQGGAVHNALQAGEARRKDAVGKRSQAASAVRLCGAHAS